MRGSFYLGLILAAAGCVAPLRAQPTHPNSPHEKASVTLSGHSVTVEYGRPYLKGRKAVGGALVPYGGEVWRTGADEATTLTTAADLLIGDLKVPAGTYSLFTIAAPGSWTLIVNKRADQWGAFTYDKALDLGRASMSLSKPGALVEQFTIAFKSIDDKSALLTLTWENMTASVPVKLQ